MQTKDRTGESRMATCGQMMTIVRYGNSKDIDVQFEDGTVVKNRRYRNFSKGSILNPNCNVDMVGETITSTYGQKMTIIRYGSSDDIDVQFEDGTVVKNKKYSNFKRGKIKNPNYEKHNDKIGEENISFCGQTMRIIRYGKFSDIDVQFSDGTIVRNKSYGKFKKGAIQNPNSYISPRIFALRQKYEGETATNSSGQKMTIIKYNSSNDIDVQFSDGTIVTGRTYGNFKKGVIENPNYDLFSNRLGEESVSKGGQKMVIIKYNNSSDIDVQFSDGTIVKNKSYDNFKKGEIRNPNYHLTKLGEESISTSGQKMVIIKYNSSNDIDVQFSDGTIVRNKLYSCFKKGTIKNPNYDNRVGQEKTSFCGLKMTIIKYNNNRDVDVQFEDGEIIKRKSYYNFTNGNIAHPFLSARLHSVYKNIDTQHAWTEGDKVYYICKCQICGEEGIWTPQEIIEHAKKHE